MDVWRDTEIQGKNRAHTRRTVRVVSMSDIVTERRLTWFGHVIHVGSTACRQRRLTSVFSLWFLEGAHSKVNDLDCYRKSPQSSITDKPRPPACRWIAHLGADEISALW